MWLKNTQEKTTIIGVYVDDLLITGNDEKEIQSICKTMERNFKMKNIGDMQDFLGVQAKHKQNETKLHQERYTNRIVKTFGEENCKHMKTPMPKQYEPDHEYPVETNVGTRPCPVPKTRDQARLE